MKRRLLIAAVFLLAGAVVNVAVAWGCNWLAPTPQVFRPLPDLDAKIDWPHAVPDGWPSRPIFLADGTSVGRTTTVPISGDFQYRIIVSQYGLPLQSMEYHMLLTTPDNQRPSPFTWTIVAAWQTSTFAGTVPLRPIWSGFAVNTIFYVTILWLLSGGPFRLRRFIRVRRGLCPACAYPHGESDVCSECGGALPERARETA